MGIEWTLALFTIVAGSGASILAFAGLSEFFAAGKKTRFIATIIALVLLIAGGCISLLHLQNPANFMSAAANLFSFSPISVELILLGLSVIVAIIYLVTVSRGGAVSKVMGACGVIVGVVFCYVSGHGYEVISVRPAWDVPVLALSYVFSAITVGGFIFLSLQMLFKDEAASIKKIAYTVLLVAALNTIGYIIYALMAPLGESAALFWVGAVVIGGVVAVIVGFFAHSKNSMPIAWAGVVAALVGAVVFRAVMWLAGSTAIPSFFDLAQNSRGVFPF